jgi:hypothetical protein
MVKHPKLTKQYTRSICQQVIDVFSEGGTLPEFLDKKKIIYSTWRGWLARYPELKEAYELAKIAKIAHSHSTLRDWVLEDKAVKNKTALEKYIKHILELEDNAVQTTINVDADKMNDEMSEDIEKYREKWQRAF